jgi:hypothetical protein
MREIGPLVRLQVQRSTLKTGERPHRTYSPAPILAVPRLWASPEGALGEGPDGAWVVDVHHPAHPTSKHDAHNPLSVGFTSHYHDMRRRFGERVGLGCAGENLIAETDGRWTFEALQGGLAVLTPDGSERLRLEVVQAAHPCRPFTGWAAGGMVESAVLKEHLQFLDDGTRGFYCRALGSATLAVGDLLVVL